MSNTQPAGFHLVTRSGAPYCEFMGCQAGQGIARAAGVEHCSYQTREAADVAQKALTAQGLVCEVVPGQCPQSQPPALSPDQAAALQPGDVVRVHAPVMGGVYYGDQNTEYELSAPAGHLGVVSSLDRYEGQGLAVTVAMITGAPGVINVFDETDTPRYPLELLSEAETAIVRQLGAAAVLLCTRYHEDLNGKEEPHFNDARAPDGDTFNDFSGEIEFWGKALLGDKNR